MAGLGWKLWTRERLTADEMQGYLQDQVVLQFASASERDAVLGVSPASGLHVHLLDTGRTLVRYAGAWVTIGRQPRAHLYATANQTGLLTGYQTINMAAAKVDTHGGMNAGGYIVPAGWGGPWRATGVVAIGAVGASGISVGGRVVVNTAQQVGSPPILLPASSPNGTVLPLPVYDLELNSGDVVALQGYVATGGWSTLGAAGTGASTSVLRLERIAS